MENTFNISFVFGTVDAVYTLVCYNEDGVDRNSVVSVVKETFQNDGKNSMSIENLIRTICTNVTNECNCQAVFVRSDAQFHIQRQN